MSRSSDIEARWRESLAPANNVMPLPPQWFDETTARLQANARREGERKGYVEGTRYGMLIGLVWGLVLAAGATRGAIELGWLKVLVL